MFYPAGGSPDEPVGEHVAEFLGEVLLVPLDKVEGTVLLQELHRRLGYLRGKVRERFGLFTAF